MASKQQTVTVAGRRLKLTSLDKVLYPETGTTKADVIEYLQTVAPAMLPHLQGRPVTRKRWPSGPGTAEAPKDAFFRKDLEDSAPTWVPRLGLQHSDHVNVYPLAEHEAVLAWFGQVSALELHVPQWRFDAEPFDPSQADGDPPVAAPQNPDRLVLDLDPGPGTDLSDCARVAGWCREILDDMGLPSVPVTSGSKGIHLYAQLDGTSTSDQVSQVAKALARSLESDHPDEVVSRMKRADRKDKVFLDWSQNSGSKTTIAPYSLRGRSQPWVAAPRTWDEIFEDGLRQLDFDEVVQRLDSGLNPFSAFETTAPSSDALSEYRSMRDAAKTPEPVPDSRPLARRGDPIFVVQEHHARRLHFDTRLERDGVLVSWAVPKGPPLKQGQQRLAVQTEDHPIEYADFEGTIPKGEYGAGDVTIWDSGTATIEKWQPDKVVFVLHGKLDGGLGGVERRYALVQTDSADRQWLMRLTKRQPKAASLTVQPLPSPMLATAGQPRDVRGSGWTFEAKWDGYRMLAAVRKPSKKGAAAVELRSRSGNDYTAVFPELHELAGLASEGTVLDGEVIAVNASGRPDFSRLQKRGQLTEHRDVEREAKRIPVQFMVFDVLSTKQQGDVTGLPYLERRTLLHALVSGGEHVQVPTDLGNDLEAAFESTRDLQLEGVIAKRDSSVYEPGERSREWIKIKHAHHADVKIIGWRRGKGGRANTFGSLLLGMATGDGTLSYVGRVGTGFNDRQLASIRRALDRLVRKTPPLDDVPPADARDATWVTPSQSAEVQHSGLTGDGRLRHPVWRTLK